MNKRHVILCKTLSQKLIGFHRQEVPLPGVLGQNCAPTRLETLTLQLVDSYRRVDRVANLRTRSTKLSRNCSDPVHESFDPIKAAIRFQEEGLIEEAFWMVFLYVHFGKHPKSGWHYARTIYGKYDDQRWSWSRISTDVRGFRSWLDAHQDYFKSCYHLHGFGNHRKYESLDAYSDNGTGAVVQSYVNWIAPPRTHKQLVDKFTADGSGNPTKAFDALYHAMDCVCRFGRLARFDYLCMIGKIGLADIQPGTTYLKDSTGPLEGARLLFGDGFTIQELEEHLRELGRMLDLGMQVLEDGLCNWQKNPDKYQRY